MDYPWRCEQCGKQSMIDLTKLERRAVNKIVTAKGFVCAGCTGWQAVFFTTRSLDDALMKLERLDVRRKDYRFHFGKALRKAEGVRAMIA